MIDLSNESYVVLDIETVDPDLLSLGPGPRRNGNILGIGVRGGTSKRQEYVRWGHVSGNNCTDQEGIRWAKAELCRPNQPKLGCNILYDLDFLYHYGIRVTGPFYDIQIAEPLIDENQRSFSLNAQAKKYLGEGKRDEELVEYCKDRGWNGVPQKHFKDIDGELISKYVMGDLELPDRVFDIQKVLMAKLELLDIFRLETKLIPMLLAMRQRGVRVDKSKAEQCGENIEQQIQMNLARLSSEAGMDVNVNSNDQMGKAMDALGIKYGHTKTGKASVTKEFLESSQHPFLELVRTTKKLKTISNLVINGIINQYAINGRIHASFNQLRSDDSGTVTGRFSGSNPNLQQIPARDKILGPMCRSLFIPEEGEEWSRLDYSQIELRILAHYARGPGATDIREAYIKTASTDFHQWCADIAKIERRKAKDINFGLVYGMGVNKLATTLKLSKDDAKAFLSTYHDSMPFLKRTINDCVNACETQGFVRTILGRRRNFPWWECKDYHLSKKIPMNLDKEDLIRQIEEYRTAARVAGDDVPIGGIHRSMKHKALNAVIQGSAADLMKKAMVDIWESGVIDILGAPLVTVHDELGWSVPKTKQGRSAMDEVKRLMESAIKLTVPVIADMTFGAHWGECK